MCLHTGTALNHGLMGLVGTCSSARTYRTSPFPRTYVQVQNVDRTPFSSRWASRDRIKLFFTWCCFVDVVIWPCHPFDLWQLQRPVFFTSTQAEHIFPTVKNAAFCRHAGVFVPNTPLSHNLIFACLIVYWALVLRFCLFIGLPFACCACLHVWLFIGHSFCISLCLYLFIIGSNFALVRLACGCSLSVKMCTQCAH